MVPWYIGEHQVMKQEGWRLVCKWPKCCDPEIRIPFFRGEIKDSESEGELHTGATPRNMPEKGPLQPENIALPSSGLEDFITEPPVQRDIPTLFWFL